jgi:tripartite-type tricarboxylate transporter receptor subunit TctC
MGHHNETCSSKFSDMLQQAAPLSALPRFVWALDYPTLPVRILVGFPAGGPTDIIARLITQYLAETMANRSGSRTVRRRAWHPECT